MKRFLRGCVTYLLISFSCVLYTKTTFAAIQGPATITLLNQGTLKIPADCFFLPKNEAIASMKKIDDTPVPPTFIGLIVTNDFLMITVDFVPSGYLVDNDAKSWGADDLMNQLKKMFNNTENEDQTSMGLSSAGVIGWEDEPTYDVLTHHWVWSYLFQDEGVDNLLSINYHAYAFGRYGYFKLSFATPNKFFAENKITVENILSTLHFNNGKRYEDYNENTDLAFGYSAQALITDNTDVKLIYFFADKFLIFLGAIVFSLIVNISVWQWRRIQKRSIIKNNDMGVDVNK